MNESNLCCFKTVSYTHLDVYKRQILLKLNRKFKTLSLKKVKRVSKVSKHWTEIKIIKARKKVKTQLRVIGWS